MQVIYNDVDITRDISIRRCVHDMYAGGHCDELLLSLNDPRRLWDRWGPGGADVIQVVDGSADTGKMYLRGIVPKNDGYIIRALSAPPSMENWTAKSWENIHLMQLAAEIAARHGLVLRQYGVTDWLYAYVTQDRPDLSFLSRRALLEGASVIVLDGALVLYDEAAAESAPPVMSLSLSPAGEYSLCDRSPAACGLAEIRSGDMVGRFSDGSGRTKSIRRAITEHISTPGEADRFARGMLRAANKQMRAGVIYSDSLRREIAPGSMVNIVAEGAISWIGPAFVDRVRHDYAQHTSKITFRKPLEGY